MERVLTSSRRESGDPVRLSFVTLHDGRDVAGWSGIPAFMSRGFARHGVYVQYVGPLRERRKAWYMAKQVAYRGMRTRHLRDREPGVLDGWSRQVEAALDEAPSDFVLSPGSTPIAHLREGPRVVFWTDATFGGLVGFYPSFSWLSGASISDGHRQERRALNRVDLALYASRWAARSAIELYDADPAKVHVVPFGANLDSARTPGEIAALVERKPMEPCRLVWFGAEWDRKRGPFVIDMAEELIRSGLPTEVVFAGATGGESPLPWFARHIGMLDKSTAAGRARVDELLAAAHFLVLPSVAEAFGVVFAEASAYGVPSLANDVGGVADAVDHGKNGLLFPLDAEPADFATAILDLMAAPSRYRQLALAARRRYDNVLNWDVATGRALELMANLT
jgi:glycosyltransferase involved in cell wall biosynthesis